MDASVDGELIYVGDPMCSWCWGFSPVLDGLQQNLGLPLRVMLGGLSTGDAVEEVDDRLAGMLAHHWHQVHEASGQPFDHRILERRGWRYDTELPCRAVVAMRELAPERTKEFFDRLHRAFYAEGIDITVAAPYPELVGSVVPDVDAFMASLGSELTNQRTLEDFVTSRQLGIGGYPTLLLRRGTELAMATKGWASLDVLEPAIRNWLNTQVEGAACELGEPC
jgi:putative protein-disulfide isomerase